MTKRFRIPAREIRDITRGRGSCLASDRITVDGQRVGYCYREEPANELDSGWRFFAGTEEQEYVDDPANLGLYNVNTIANYDPEVVPLLDSPPGCAFARLLEDGAFASVEPPEPPD